MDEPTNDEVVLPLLFRDKVKSDDVAVPPLSFTTFLIMIKVDVAEFVEDAISLFVIVQVVGPETECTRPNMSQSPLKDIAYPACEPSLIV